MLRTFSSYISEKEVTTPSPKLDDAPFRIPSRYPTAPTVDKKGVPRQDVDHPHDRTMTIGIHEMKRNPVAFKHNMGVMRDSKVYADAPKEHLRGANANKVAEVYHTHFVNNLLHVHDTMDKDVCERASRWYDGAHKIATERAHQYGLHPATTAAVFAALSPQKSWHENVSLGDRVLSALHTKQHENWSPEMDAVSQKIWKPEHQHIVNEVRGKKLSQLSDPVHKAMWIRTHDEAHNDRHYKIVAPEGHMTEKIGGQYTRWQALSPIAKAVTAVHHDGDIHKISELMGQKHKVRSFYNNIIHPNSPFGDVTVDTHAVGANFLKPVGQSHMYVNHAFGTSPMVADQPKNWKPVKTGGTATGVQGLYGVHADAYRTAAAMRGIHPRQMQSITWEGMRMKFPETMKIHDRESMDKITKIWHSHHTGEIDGHRARKEIDRITGGLAGKKPDWD